MKQAILSGIVGLGAVMLAGAASAAPVSSPSAVAAAKVELTSPVTQVHYRHRHWRGHGYYSYYDRPYYRPYYYPSYYYWSPRPRYYYGYVGSYYPGISINIGRRHHWHRW